MNRDIYRILQDWKHTQNRRPLLIRGARQVGKTYIINEFGKNEFSDFITLNFEKNPEYKDIFSTLDPGEILEKISLFTNKPVIPGETLLFLDEIQDCVSAIMALRYFYEEKPALHVIGAGSLLEFALESENFRMPVGRVQYLYMHPLSFGEFLQAMDQDKLRQYILNPENLQTISDSLHRKLNEHLRKYFVIGGMPAVVSEYINRHDIIGCQKIQRSIIDTYLDDFGKYVRNVKHRYLSKVFHAVPTMVGQKFVYARVDDTIKSRELKEAVELLEMAGVVMRIKRTKATKLPLESGVKTNHFKMLFMDIGLFHAINGIYTDTAQAKDFNALYNGAVAEQFVGQELIAHSNEYSKPNLYFWAREAKNSNAELDYLIQKDSDIIPVKLKSGAVGKLKSLRLFMESYQKSQGFKISQAPFSRQGNITCLPLYAIEYFVKSSH